MLKRTLRKPRVLLHNKTCLETLSNQAEITWWGLAVQLYSAIQRKGAVWIQSASEKNIFYM